MGELHLRFISGPRRGQRFSFSSGRVRIGRSRDNDLILPQEERPRSSGHHAEAVFDHGTWWISDVRSTNGTFLNGTRVSRERLRNGDEIGFGGSPLLVATVSSRRRLLFLGGSLLLVAGSVLALWEARQAGVDFQPAAAAAV
ncbi:MAG: FHA domain-containing protein, partial [Acidobacteriota bacterium]